MLSYILFNFFNLQRVFTPIIPFFKLFYIAEIYRNCFKGNIRGRVIFYRYVFYQQNNFWDATFLFSRNWKQLNSHECSHEKALRTGAGINWLWSRVQIARKWCEVAMWHCSCISACTTSAISNVPMWHKAG